METKQKQLRCSAHAARQDGSGACRAKESTNGPAWVCMQYIQWAHYVCASWDEVRARVHARGHTQRVREGRVCVRAVHGSLSPTLTRPPPQQPHTQQEEEAKEGRWCGRPRCCRHCHQASPFHLLWRFWLALFPSDWLLYFHFCFSSRVPVPSAAGSLFGMPSSVLLSALSLAKLPFSVGDGGFVSAWPSDGSFCELAVMGATPSFCELLFNFMPLWGCCSCCTGTVSSGLDCPFTRACVESPSVFPIVFSATSAGAFVSDGDVSCGIFYSFAAFSSVPVGELSFLFSLCSPASSCTACFDFFVSSSSSLTLSNAPTPRSGMFGGILTPLSSVGLTVEDALLSEGLFQL
ncbi:hypothetical protein ECC02_011272 [Trypanosoma cruzi]|uniref:Uncharacterized protein n=1 Tax=Trypanosoma cruzi TaxID=5693 RepID=A0A7J6XN89_TRYCR|nr:hypothetical protein ECC02_011272 [Trypanosoma cruzi]